MSACRLYSLALALAAVCLCQTTGVGSGAPNEGVRQLFQAAYLRGGFNLLVSLPPVGNVRRYGSTGLIQEFQDAAKTANTRLALIKADTSATLSTGDDSTTANDVYQVLAAMYEYYSTIGASTAGYPTMDTTGCPAVSSNTCQYQFFSLNYVLFVFQQSTIGGGQEYTLRDPFFTKWSALGGIGGMGGAVTAEATVTSSSGATATAQSCERGVIYNVTSGTLKGRILGVRQPIYDVYVESGGHAVFLGFPSSEELTLASGRRRQNFENGAIEYDPGGVPVLRWPVSSVSVVPNTLRLNLGDTVTLTAKVLVADGTEMPDRVVSWTSSNGRVATVETVGNGLTATVRAVGGGTAVITATSEGKVSTPVSVSVSAPCCQVGEGAPTAVIQQAFQDAVTRNRLSVRLPAPNPVRRLGNGYVQELQAAATGARLLVAKSDRSAAAYFLTGDILTRYEELGGPAGSLGYPASDPTSGARQLFENDAALAGSPVRLVASPILAKWATLGYETGSAGPPAEEAATFLTFAGTAGKTQSFRDGDILAGQMGPQAGKAFLVRGLILARYGALGKASGMMGMPVNEEFASGDRRRQDFEGGYIDYAAGDTQAAAYERERKPAVSAAPGVVTAGSRVRLTVSGFDNGAKVRVSVSGQPDFEVTTLTGAYSWEVLVPAAAASATVTLRATDTASSKSAEGSYRIRSAAETQFQLRKLLGDAQTGSPGALLPRPLRIALRDEGGNPVTGAQVRFNASPGGQVNPATAVTDDYGEAAATLRLPPAEGVALATAEAGRQVVTFSAISTRSVLASFPGFTQTGETPLGAGPGTLAQKGALLAAAASILRYHQNRGELPAPYGTADPPTLNQFLTNRCLFDLPGAQVCDGFIAARPSGEQVANLWRLADFVNGNLTVSVEKPDLDTLRDLVSQGTPVLVGLALAADGAPAGSHFLVAVGVAADGGVQIHDPSPLFARSSLGEYLGGFSLGSRTFKGTLASLTRLQPNAPSATGFLVTGDVAFEVTSVVGACGRLIEWPDTPAPAERAPGVFRLRYCDGAQAAYQLDVSSAASFQLTVTDLASGGSRFEVSGAAAAAYKLARPAGQLVIAPQDVSFSAGAVVNAATFMPGVAPGGLVAIFGAGLARAGVGTVVEIGGLPALLIAASPFQLNVQAPSELKAGPQRVVVRSPYGVAEQTVEFADIAPAIFLLEGGRGAVVNQDFKLNLPSNPALRGQAVVVYGTGFGAVSQSGKLWVVRQPVMAVLQGLELPAAFAGLAPGYPGLYQVNVVLPRNLPPGLDVPLVLKQGGASSNSVPAAIQ